MFEAGDWVKETEGRGRLQTSGSSGSDTPPARHLLRQNACGDTQGLARIPILPGSAEHNFMSQLTLRG